jgi:hypothetical protein
LGLRKIKVRGQFVVGSDVVICEAFGVYFIVIITIEVVKLKEFFDISIGIIIRHDRLNYGIMTKTACSISVVVIDP